MLIVHILFTVKPTEHATLQQIMQECIALAGSMPGCRTYGFFADQSKTNAYLLYEEWENKENFDAYKASSVFKEVGNKLTPLLAGAPASTYFLADSNHEL